MTIVKQGGQQGRHKRGPLVKPSPALAAALGYRKVRRDLGLPVHCRAAS